MRFTRRDNMKRHFNSRHENMKFNSPLPPPPPQDGYVYTPPPSPQEGYIYTPSPPPQEGCICTHPPPPQEGYIYTPPPPRGLELSSLQHQTENPSENSKSKRQNLRQSETHYETITHKRKHL